MSVHLKGSFFVFSLPRSGTAWLSVFLSGTGGFCYHEILADLKRLTDIPERLSRSKEEVVGAIDTLAYVYASEIRAMMPSTKFFVVHREPADIALSLKRCGIKPYDVRKEYERLLVNTLRCEVIKYERLHELSYLEWVWKQVIGTCFDRERARQLMQMRIERDIHALAARVPALKAMLV